MADLNKIISNLPLSPGVYQFFDSKGTILYVGKAKNLKSRVSSYFNKTKYESFKVKKLAAQVCDIRHIVVDSESDALLLENNLIKQYQPKYNILLKDDKTFPWICIKNESFPRIFSTRRRIKDGSVYYGPYTSAYMVKTLINLVRQLYQIRTCTHNLSEKNISAEKFKICLEYHLGNCKGPCIGLQNTEDYNQSINQIQEILRGNLQNVLDYIYNLMMDFASKQKFEDAENLKRKYELLENFKSKSTIVSTSITDIDVFSYVNEGNKAYVNFLKIIEGGIVQSHTVELSTKLDESPEDILLYAIIDIREKVFSKASTILVPFRMNNIDSMKFIVPKIGDKRKLMELSERNARQFALQKHILKQEIDSSISKNSIVHSVKNDLRLKELPTHIECFDNSNLQGEFPVASCVVFKNGKPANKLYRHFHIKSVKGANDFASMEEIVFRRYKRLLDENETLPQLIIVDGGKGQLSSAVKSLKRLNIYGKVSILGIAKKLEELYFPGDSVPLYLDKNSRTLKLIQHMRNEAHRFGITFHRNVRSKSMVKNSLLDIKGIGDKTLFKLYDHFGGIDEIKNQSIESLSNVVTKIQAEKLYNYFRLGKLDEQ